MRKFLIGTIGLLAIAFMTLPALAETIYTGDKIQGRPVISKLNINDLEKGKIHHLLFQSVETGTGQRWYVPVLVARGLADGKKLLLITGVHGDESSPVAVIQQVFSQLDPQKMSGTVVGVLDVSRASVEQVQRQWPVSASAGSLVDMNQVWPGKEFGNAAQRQAWLVWNNLFSGNADLVLDFHTASTGHDFAWFVFADYRNPESRRLGELFPVTQIKDDPGLEGSLATTFLKANTPAVTVEVGGPRHFDKKLIKAGVEGVVNIMADYKITADSVGRTAKDVNCFFGNDMEAIHAKTGGYIEMLVDLDDSVAAGQKVAVQRDSFGQVLHEYTAGVSGKVAVIARDALREPGAHLLSILTFGASSKPYDTSGIAR